MAKNKGETPGWVTLTKQLSQELGVPKKAMRKAVDATTFRLAVMRVAEERLDGILAEIGRSPQKGKRVTGKSK